MKIETEKLLNDHHKEYEIAQLLLFPRPSCPLELSPHANSSPSAGRTFPKEKWKLTLDA